MGLVVLDISMSLDGFVAGPNVAVERPLGDRGERLHGWMFAGRTGQEAAAFEQASFRTTGSVVMGRRTFEVGEGPGATTPSTCPASCSPTSHGSRW